ncbi:unnamed protein product [Ectocarpus fasciculatus]
MKRRKPLAHICVHLNWRIDTSREKGCNALQDAPKQRRRNTSHHPNRIVSATEKKTKKYVTFVTASFRLAVTQQIAFNPFNLERIKRKKTSDWRKPCKSRANVLYTYIPLPKAWIELKDGSLSAGTPHRVPCCHLHFCIILFQTCLYLAHYICPVLNIWYRVPDKTRL